MEDYLEEYGYHINKRLFDFAVSLMKDRNGQPLKPWDKDRVSEFLRAHNVTLRNSIGHDAAYVFNMAMADYYGSSITDDTKISLFVKDYLEDPDGSPTKAFDHFYIDCIAKGIPIFWDEMI